VIERELYLDRKTVFHGLDPRSKVLVLVTFFVIILYFQDPLWIAPISVLVLIHGVGARAMTNLRPLRYILLVLTVSSMILWNLFSNGKTPLFWFVEVESFLYSIGRTLILLSLVVEGVVFLSTTRQEEFTLGLIKLGLPYRVGFAISAAFRMVPMVVTSAYAVAQAQKSRGLDLDSGNIFQRIRKYVPLLVPVFLSMIRSSNTFVMALDSRGFGARKKRSYYLEIGFKSADFVCLAILLLLFTLATYSKIAGYGNITGLERF